MLVLEVLPLKEDILEEYEEVLEHLHARPSLIGNVINLIRDDSLRLRASSA